MSTESFNDELHSPVEPELESTNLFLDNLHNILFDDISNSQDSQIS